MTPRQQRHRSRSKRHRNVRDGGILRDEFDANIRRLDERMNRMFAKSDERAAQQRKAYEEQAELRRKEYEKRSEQYSRENKKEHEERLERQRREYAQQEEQRRKEREKRDEQYRKECDERRELQKKDYERRLEESDRRANAFLKGMDQRIAIELNGFREMMDVNMRSMDRRVDDMKQHFTAIREEIVEIRKESKLLRWNIWIAAGTTVLGVAGAMSAMNSVIISAFESGRSASATTARQATPSATPPSAEKMPNLSRGLTQTPNAPSDVSTHTPLYRREDAEDTLKDNRSQS